MSTWTLMPRDSAGLLITLGILLALAPALGAAAQEAVVVSIPVTVNNEAPRSVDARISGEQELLALGRSGIADALAPVASQAIVRQIEEGEGAWVSVSRIEELGLPLSFDPAGLAARVDVPIDKMPRRDVSVLSQAGETSYPELAPARGSASLLLRSRVDHRYFEGTHSLEFQGRASPAIALSTTTAEADIGVDTARDAPLTVEAMRFMADFLKPGIRLTAGDLEYPVRGLQSFVPTFGLSLHREDALLSSDDVQSRGGSAIEISEPSEARFLVNGQTVQTQRLEPGRYNLTDFPLLPGVNDVRIVLENDLGEETVIEDVLPFAPRLLPEGRYDYSGALGFPRWSVTEPLVSGFYYRGFTQRMTAGLYAQATLERQLAGVGSVFATRIGNIRVDAAGSRNQEGRLAGSVLGEYRFALPAAEWVPRVSFLGHYRHPAFTGVSAAGDTVLPEWNLTATMAQKLPLGIGMNVSLRRQIFPTERPDVTTLSGGLSRSIGRNASVTASARAGFVGGQTDWGARI
ncbi:MAG: hypothetical protein GVY29_00350, partial [Spirochaetes bacterium]|nr:hypothetical protein [Spirochaetota bacterium]